MKIKYLLLIPFVFTVISCAQKNSQVPEVPSTGTETGNPGVQKRWTFSRAYSEGGENAPRGGTSKGAPVVLDTSPNTAFISISEPGITKFEQDRRAVLAMAGTYKTSFDFVETMALKPGYVLDRPYQSWATEVIEVIEDTGDFISLQHILVMYLIDDEGNRQGPFVSKHWRQDWKYEDDHMLVYTGNNAWKRVEIEDADSKGKWTQAVYQVDDSPRYESIGEWVHEDNFSEWTSGDTWRPLPRREFSVRDDYNVLKGVNRQIVTADGWAHEQDNIKLVVDERGAPIADNPYIAKEVGLNRYERITGDEYEPGSEYWRRTGEFWKDVRKAWADEMSGKDSVTLKNKHEGKKLYQYLFEYAGEVEERGAYDKPSGEEFAKETIKLFVVPSGEATDKSVY